MILGVSLFYSPWHLILLLGVFYITMSPVVSIEQLPEILCISRTLSCAISTTYSFSFNILGILVLR